MHVTPSYPRGFPRLDFTDHYDQQSSLQLSSLAYPRCIWLGINNPTVQRQAEGCSGWQEVSLPAGSVIGSRMHLTQDQVKALLPFLQEFAETGHFTPY